MLAVEKRILIPCDIDTNKACYAELQLVHEVCLIFSISTSQQKQAGKAYIKYRKIKYKRYIYIYIKQVNSYVKNNKMLPKASSNGFSSLNVGS